MTDQEIQEIYNRLLELTKAQAVQWKKTGDYEYSVNFSRSSVVIEKDYSLDSAPIVLEIYNQDGLQVAYAAPEDLEENDEIKAFIFDPSELFNLVQNQVYKYSETSKNILDELKELDVRLKKTG
jgi:hypothetical protein